MRKAATVLLKIFFTVLAISFSILLYLASTSSDIVDTAQESPTPEPTNDINQQLQDVQKKIDELPDLEKDIFSKCIENKEKTAENIRGCEESTQKQIYTLSQELNNLKESLTNDVETNQ